MKRFLQKKPNYYTRGQVVLAAVLLFLFISCTIVFGIARGAYHQLKGAFDFSATRSSFYLAESLAEDFAYRYSSGFPISDTPSMIIDGNTANAVVTNEGLNKQIIATSNWRGLFRRVRAQITQGFGARFSYGVQVGNGGFHGENNSIIFGNLFSNGPITGSTLIKGDVISGGPAGFVSGIHSTSSVYAHTISGVTIDKDAYYQVISSSVVGGISHPGSPDQATSTLPISDSYIENLKSIAESGGVTNCTGTYSLLASTVGPRKYTCNVNIKGDITLTGPLWIEGNITTSNNVEIRVSPAFSGKTMAIITDKPSDRINSSKVILTNNVEFYGSGERSFVLFISMNNAEEVNSANTIHAIDANNNISGSVLFYAPHGQINIENNTSLKELSGYRVQIAPNAQIQYETGIASFLFIAGPTGGFNVVDWRETQ